jgi:hypothetical protein
MDTTAHRHERGAQRFTIDRATYLTKPFVPKNLTDSGQTTYVHRPFF